MNNLKKTLALMAALVMSATAFVGCGKDDESSSSSSSASESSSESEGSESEEPSEGDDSSESSEITDAKSTEVGEIDSSVGTGGSTFTVAAWNRDDVPYLLAQYKGIDFTQFEDSTDVEKAVLDLEDVNFINFDVGGGQASEKYDAHFATGDDLDVYFCEADWALKYINDDERTLPLEKLGFTDANFADLYGYTDEIGKDANGVRKGVSWQAAAGGFAYRYDLAEEYLGVTSPEEMQEAISDWDKFVTAAETISEKSGGKTALADTINGMWQVFAAQRSQPWVVDNSLVVDDFCKDFADTAKALWDCGGVTKNPQWDPSWYASGQDDSAMGFFVSTWGFGDSILAQAAGGKDGATYGKWAVCQGPNPYFWGGTWIVVNPQTDNGQEAQDFIKMFTVDNDAIKEYAINKPEYCNNKTVMQDIVDSKENPNEYVTDCLNGQNYFEVLHENAKNIDLKGLITPYDATIKTAFCDVVKSEYLEGGKSWDDTQIAFMEKVAAAIPELD